MKYVIVHNLSKPQVQPIVAAFCTSFFSRLRGLTFRRYLPAGEGLVLVQESDSRLDSSIHMMGVWMDLAVAWINSAGEVVDVRLAKRWRPAYLPQRPARFVLEMTAAHLDDFHIGDKVRFDETRLD